MRYMCLLGILCCISVASAGISLDLNSIQYIFAFGDSYTSSTYSPSLGIFNQSFVSSTSGGKNWLMYLSESTTAADKNFFDLAAPGATINTTIVDSYTIPDLITQISTFETYFIQQNRVIVPWKGDDTLFTIWIGINDIGFTYINGDLYPPIFKYVAASYIGQISRLYQLGARNFLLLGLPPTDRTPLVQSLGPKAVLSFQSNLNLWNAGLYNFVATIPTIFPGASVTLFDTLPFFNTILDSPRQYGFLNSTAACPEYVTVIDVPEIALAVCTWPLSEYFWHNSYHPSFSVHKLLAQSIESVLLVVNSIASPAAPSFVIPTQTIPLAATFTSSPSAAPTGINSLATGIAGATTSSSSTSTASPKSTNQSTSGAQILRLRNIRELVFSLSIGFLVWTLL